MLPVWLKWFIRIFFFCSTLFILQYTSLFPVNSSRALISIFYFAADHRKYNSDDFINLGFNQFEFEQAKLRETQLELEYDLTAVLLHWQRLQGVQKTLKHFLDTHLFKQIIVWNNNPQINLSIHNLTNSSHPAKFIRIINSKVNLKDEAKYRACAEAKTRACFYVDDDWNPSHYTKSLIASFRSDPNLLHSVTNSYTYYTNLVWSYFDTTIDLHAGFSWIGSGSIFLREHAQRHLRLLHKFLKNNSNLIHLSDVFFSIWLNDIPCQMDTDIRGQYSSSSNRSLSFSSIPGFFKSQKTSSILAIRILERFLRLERSNNNDITTFSRQQDRRFPYYVKSPSFSDDFIFYSNVLPFELQNVPFNISRDFQRGTRRNLPWNSTIKYIVSHSTWKAVDGKLRTCWDATRTIRSGDFFAIDFLRVTTNVTFIISVAHSSKLQINLDVRISFDGLKWISYHSQKGIYAKMNRTSQQQLYTTLFNSNQFTSGFQSFRYIAFKAINKSDDRFQVCELQIISKTKFNDILCDFL